MNTEEEIKIPSTHIKVYIDKCRETGVPYTYFWYKNVQYRTNLRGRHQALFCAHIVERRLRDGVKFDEIDRELTGFSLDGRFETLMRSPYVIFDIVEKPRDTKNFVINVDDYFGRKVQRSLATRDNLHPDPFRKLIIATVVHPDLIRIKQNVTIIFTSAELERQYLAMYKGIVKTFVMPFLVAINHAVNNYPGHKIFVIGDRNLYEKTRSIIC